MKSAAETAKEIVSRWDGVDPQSVPAKELVAEIAAALVEVERETLERAAEAVKAFAADRWKLFNREVPLPEEIVVRIRSLLPAPDAPETK